MCCLLECIPALAFVCHSSGHAFGSGETPHPPRPIGCTPRALCATPARWSERRRMSGASFKVRCISFRVVCPPRSPASRPRAIALQACCREGGLLSIFLRNASGGEALKDAYSKAERATRARVFTILLSGPCQIRLWRNGPNRVGRELQLAEKHSYARLQCTAGVPSNKNNRTQKSSYLTTTTPVHCTHLYTLHTTLRLAG